MAATASKSIVRIFILMVESSSQGKCLSRVEINWEREVRTKYSKVATSPEYLIRTAKSNYEPLDTLAVIHSLHVR